MVLPQKLCHSLYFVSKSLHHSLSLVWEQHVWLQCLHPWLLPMLSIAQSLQLRRYKKQGPGIFLHSKWQLVLTWLSEGHDDSVFSFLHMFKYKAMEFWLTSYLHLTPRWYYHLSNLQDYTLEQAASAGKGQSKQQGTKTTRGVRRELSHISAVTCLTAWFSPEPPQPSGMDSARDFQPKLNSQTLFT